MQHFVCVEKDPCPNSGRRAPFGGDQVAAGRVPVVVIDPARASRHDDGLPPPVVDEPSGDGHDFACEDGDLARRGCGVGVEKAQEGANLSVLKRTRACAEGGEEVVVNPRHAATHRFCRAACRARWHRRIKPKKSAA